MVLVMVIIFSSLILAVVISSSTAIRRAHFYKDKTISLQAAEAGMQEAFYWMNYKGYSAHQYPPSGTYYFQGSDYAGSDTWIAGEASFNPAGIPQAECMVQIRTTGAANSDTMLSTGYYRGRTSSVSAVIRGDNVPASPLKGSTQGISEAFNKKAVYAKTVNLTSSGTTVKGNITTSSTKPAFFPWTETTWTETGISVTSDMVRFETENYSFSLPSAPLAGTYDDTYSDTGFLYNSAYPGGVDVNTLANGVYWNGSDTYFLGRSSDNASPETFIATGKVAINADAVIPNQSGHVAISNYFKASSIEIRNDITTAEDNGMFAFDTGGGNFAMVNNPVISGDIILIGQSLTLNNTIQGNAACSHNITVSGGTIQGNVLSRSNITVSGGSIAGSIVCNDDTLQVHNITINGAATINSANSEYDAAILVYNSFFQDAANASTGIVQIDAPPAITLGENQKAAILVSSVGGRVNVNSNLLPVYNNTGQFCIVNWSRHTDVNIGANTGVKGSIYSFENITLDSNTETITGILVAGNTANLNGGSVVYDAVPYLEENNPEVYNGFRGGRRKYLPLPGSWEIRW